jgi:phage shock protein PspC (stress-responsive transcriptional regulator)
MKLFLKVLLYVFLFELLACIILVLIAQSASDTTVGSVVNIGYNLLSFPIHLIDKSYPFFVKGPIYMVVLPYLCNLLLQTLLVWFIAHYILNRKPKSKIE